MPGISAIDPYERCRIAVLDSDMSYVDSGNGDVGDAAIYSRRSGSDRAHGKNAPVIFIE